MASSILFNNLLPCITSSGVMVIDSASDASCICNTNSIITCGSHSTCNTFCGDFAAYNQPECCDCECPGRKAYPVSAPTGYSIRLFGAAVGPGPFDIDGDGSYYMISGTVPSVTECDTNEFYNGSYTSVFEGGYLVDCTVTHFAADGTILDIATDSIRVTLIVGPSLPDGPDAPNYNPPADYDGNNYICFGWSIDLAGEGRGWIIGEGFVWLPACTGGTYTGITGGFDGRANSVGESPATIIVAPKCTDCDGNPLYSGSPGSTCGSKVISLNYFDGRDGDGNPIYVPVTVVAKKTGPCLYFGEADGVSVGIGTVGEPKCRGPLPLQDVWWETIITTPNGNLIYGGDGSSTGDCPLLLGNFISSSIPSDPDDPITGLEFGSECP